MFARPSRVFVLVGAWCPFAPVSRVRARGARSHLFALLHLFALGRVLQVWHLLTPVHAFVPSWGILGCPYLEDSD
jgi:hypothetical protein